MCIRDRNKSTSAIKKNIAALKEQAMAKAYQNGMESAAKKSAEAEIAYKEALEDRAKAQEKVKATQKEFDKRKSEVGLGSGDKKLEKLGEDLITYKKALQEADGAVKKSSKNLNDAHKELDTYTDKYTAQANYTAYLKSLDDLSKQAKIKASDIPKSVEDGIKQGVYANPTSGKELKLSLIHI